MGFWHSKPKNGDKAQGSSYVRKPPNPTDNPEDAALARIRKNLTHDLDTFLLNNILLSIQFFDNFEREIGMLRVGPKKEESSELAEHKIHRLTTNNLYEVVAKHVLFRTQHGERSHHYEQLHMSRVYLVHDNIEVVQDRDSLNYSSPCYRFIIEKANKNRPGYVKLRADESSFPERRRVTYETIDEGVYTHIPSDSALETDEETNLNNNNNEVEDENLNEDTEIVQESNFINKSKSAETLSSAGIQRKASIKATRKVFGPQKRELNKSDTVFTPTERRLSGMIREARQGSNNFLTQSKKQHLSPAQSLPDLTLPSCSNHGADKSPYSPKNSGDSSGYKSEGGSPSQKYQSPARSQSSDSDYGYATITELMKPKPLAQHRLGHIPANSSEIPKECFTTKDVPIYDDESGKNKLFETRYYISSITFMRSFADIFSEKLAQILGFRRSIDSATLQGTRIFCDVVQTGHDSKPIKVQNEIIPTILSSTWPQEAQKWKTRQRNSGASPGMKWPTDAMMESIERLGCHLLPQGYVPTRGINNEQYLEWQLAFPDVERYLEMCLTHSQTRCLLFCLSLYKTFLEPVNTQLGFHPTYFRTLLFSECERNFGRWPEDRPGETLHKFLIKMYESLRERNLSDYFIKRRNVFESAPGAHLLKVQEKLKRIIENPVMHLLIVLRNLRYVGTNFYPVLDYKELYNIITTDNLAIILNPQLKATIRPKAKSRQEELEETDDEEDNPTIDLRKKFNEIDLKHKWNKKVRQQIEAEKAARKLTNPLTFKQRRPSVDSIDILVQPGKGTDTIRKKIILEFFIKHFIEIAKKSNLFRATRQAQFYLQHTERLVKLLQELEDSGNRNSYPYRLEIKNIRDAMETFPERRVPATQRQNGRSAQFKDLTRNPVQSTSDSSRSILKNKFTRSAPKTWSSNSEITIVVPERVPQETSISVQEVVTAESTDS